MPDVDLATLQRWMSHLVRHPRVAERAARGRRAAALVPASAFARGEVVRPNDKMTAGQRIDVYGEAYFARLGDALRGDYPGVAHALGEEGFRELAHAYARLRPSRHPNLTFFGARFPGFIAGRKGLERRAFLRDLAQLELALVESFHAEQAEPLDFAELASLAPEAWNDIVLVTNPSLRLVATAWPVDVYLQGVLEDRAPAIPGRRRSWVAVYRKNYEVWRARLTRRAFATLSALRDGQPFGAALEHAADEADRVGAWFQEWAADGLFIATGH